jgi:hypothetical protein
MPGSVSRSKSDRKHGAAARWFRLLGPSCRDLVRLTSEDCERQLPALLRWRVRLHRAFCKFCRRYAAQLRFLRTALRRFPAEAEASLPEETRDRIKQRLRNL